MCVKEVKKKRKIERYFQKKDSLQIAFDSEWTSENEFLSLSISYVDTDSIIKTVIYMKPTQFNFTHEVNVTYIPWTYNPLEINVNQTIFGHFISNYIFNSNIILQFYYSIRDVYYLFSESIIKVFFQKSFPKKKTKHKLYYFCIELVWLFFCTNKKRFNYLQTIGFERIRNWFYSFLTRHFKCFRN